MTRFRIFAPLVFMIATALAFGNSQSLDYTDPITPDAISESTHLESIKSLPLWRLGQKESALETKIAHLNEQLAELPYLQDNQQFDTFGYHSDYIPVSEIDAEGEKPLWELDVLRRFLGSDLCLALVPAVEHRSGKRKKSYGFPKRFTIEVVHENGSEVIVDWRETAFPDPGRLPVIFKLGLAENKLVRIKVYEGVRENGLEFFALGEVIPIINGEFSTVVSVKASSSYESPPYWSERYLKDHRLGLGFPIFKPFSGSSDFSLQGASLTSQSVRIRIDLGERMHIPWMNLYPAQAPDGINLPGYGFPRNLKIETLQRPKDRSPNLYYESQYPLNPGNDWLRIRGKKDYARYVDITFSDFPSYKGIPTFSLGDIEINKGGSNLALSKPITMFEPTRKKGGELSRLVDQTVSGNELYGLVTWLDGLAARKPLESQLGQLTAYRGILAQQKNNLFRVILGAVIAAIVIAAIVFVFLNFRNRRRESHQLRQQITRDLHDELGSKMATISLTSEFIALQTHNPDILKGSQSILNTAKDMSSALRDVLWFTDTGSDSLQQLVQQLAIISANQVHADMLVLRLPDAESIPKRNLNIQDKRDIIYFFREVLNNAVRHAAASEIKVQIQVGKSRLKLTVEDDGKGFTPHSASSDETTYSRKHYGMQTMQDRAKHLGGLLEVDSKPGCGTRIHLQIPLR